MIFIENWLDEYYTFITHCFMKWLRDSEGLENTAHWTRNHFSVYLHFCDHLNNNVLRLSRRFTRNNIGKQSVPAGYNEETFTGFQIGSV